MKSWPRLSTSVLAAALLVGCGGSTKPGPGGASGNGGAGPGGGMGGLGAGGGVGGNATGGMMGTGGTGTSGDAAAGQSGDGGHPDGSGAGDDSGQAGMGGNATDASSDATLPAQCLPSGAVCVTDMGCCSGICDPTSQTCKSAIATCSPVGTACSVATDCCSLSCVGGQCAAAACVADGQVCQSDGVCCSGSCQNGTCGTLNLTCKTAGNPCGGGTECCSRLCTNGTCALGASYCIQPGDLCYRNDDCCTGLCEKTAGAAAGVCKDIGTSGSGGCTQDGVVCSGCTTCCSRLCAPYAGSGVKICQPASGCRLTSNLCQKNSDCCGGDPTLGGEGAGNVTCEIAAGTDPPLGTCRNPMGCQPRGNVCGKREDNNTCGGNAREDCCDCPPPKFNCCKADSVGIYRCHGGGSTECPTGYTGEAPCCIPAGERCQMSSECCGKTPCVPDAQGVLRCLAETPGGISCVAAEGTCTTTGDCCAGLTCNITPGMTFGSCAAPPSPPPPPPPPDAGTGGASGTDAGSPTDAPQVDTAPPPTCAFYGQGCSTSVSCCGGYVCVTAGTRNTCDGTSSCICTAFID